LTPNDPLDDKVNKLYIMLKLFSSALIWALFELHTSYRFKDIVKLVFHTNCKWPLMTFDPKSKNIAYTVGNNNAYVKEGSLYYA
jgi:hypothetical protein